MTGLVDESKGATPLTHEEREGLIPSHVTLHSELNELEQQNILEADGWVFLRKRNPIGEPFGRNLHRRMSAMSGAGPELTARPTRILATSNGN
jgi:hypothetical protein